VIVSGRAVKSLVPVSSPGKVQVKLQACLNSFCSRKYFNPVVLFGSKETYLLQEQA